MDTQEITMRMHTLLGQGMKDKVADSVLVLLNTLDTDDMSEFATLMLKWSYVKKYGEPTRKIVIDK